MKKSLILCLAALGTAAFLNTSCQKSDAAANSTEKAPENGAQFKKGEGLSLTDEMKKSIGLAVAEVGEEEIASSIQLDLTASTAHEAHGTVSADRAALIKPGTEIQLHSGNATPIKGAVRGLDKVPFGLPGDLEVTVSTNEPLSSSAEWKGTIQLPATGSVTAVPVSALLKTAEGSFVYTVNGSFYVRAPVKTGVANDKLVEITDGLYSGDQIVTTPVMSLWMAELQVLRGGKACTCGH